MTDVTRPGDGDSEMAAPLDDESADGGDSESDLQDSNETAHTSARSRPSNVVLLLGAILVIVIAQLVMAWLVLSTNTQVRDQYTSANALQRCLIHAQLNENQTTDTSGTVYKAAVNTCLK